MKKILMVTPFFAPYSHAAVYRAHRFAKYLPRFGWKVYVLTVDRSFLYFIDPSLLNDLPKDVEIIPTRHIDLTLSGFKSLFNKFEAPSSSDLVNKLPQEKKKEFIKNIIDKFRKKILFLPDRYITWYPFALKEAKRIIKKEHIDVIYSTAFPFTSHLIGMTLKKKFKIPWIADFRDPGVEEQRLELSHRGFNYKINCIIEKKVMEKADLILTTCEGAKNLFLSKYKEIVDNKIICIKHGTDAELWTGVNLRERSKRFNIIYTGEYLQDYGVKFFELLKIIFERNLFERKKVEVLIIGSIKRNMFLKKEIEVLGLSDVVRLVDHLSLKDCFSALLSADATLLPGSFTNCIPIKLADYFFAKKPIITFGANDEIREMLERSGLGIFIPNEIEKGIEILLNILRGNYRFNINENYINQFNVFKQAKGLSEVLTELVSRSKL